MRHRKRPCRRRLGRGIQELTRAAGERPAGCEAQLRSAGVQTDALDANRLHGANAELLDALLEHFIPRPELSRYGP